ncbi:hypothetical protein [Caulobacter sp. 1776]|uniref:hypothetical protein n=1 Tax=Caulobacter sp. 1776 TaxID=3156420 RepID=UPI003399C6AE
MAVANTNVPSTVAWTQREGMAGTRRQIEDIVQILEAQHAIVARIEQMAVANGWNLDVVRKVIALRRDDDDQGFDALTLYALQGGL